MGKLFVRWTEILPQDLNDQPVGLVVLYASLDTPAGTSNTAKARKSQETSSHALTLSPMDQHAMLLRTLSSINPESDVI